MATFIGHRTALWALVHLNRLAGLRKTQGPKLGTFMQARCNKEDLISAAQTLSRVTGVQLPTTMDAVVFTSNERRHSARCRVHVWGKLPAQDAFIKVAAGLYLSSPEFCFVQMARELGLLELIQLGFALCGRYYPAETSRGFIDIEPLTTPQKLARFLSYCQGLHGVKRARRAVKVLIGNSRSPMETAAAMIFTLPRRLGGYGFAGASMNPRVRLSRSARKLSKWTCLYPDICWPERRFALEYNSSDFHKNVVLDEERRLALHHDCWRVQFLSSEQLWHNAQREQVACIVANALKKRLQRATERCLEARKALLEALLPKRDDAGTWIKPGWALGLDAAIHRAQAKEAGYPRRW